MEAAANEVLEARVRVTALAFLHSMFCIERIALHSEDHLLKLRRNLPFLLAMLPWSIF